MSTLGIAPGDWVLVIEHRGEQQIVRNGLAVALSMRGDLAGSRGEPAIAADFLIGGAVTCETGIVHISHRDWTEGRAALAYEELPYPPSGVCRFCRCTEQRACAGGCAWVDVNETVCTAPECLDKLDRLHRNRTGDDR